MCGHTGPYVKDIVIFHLKDDPYYSMPMSCSIKNPLLNAEFIGGNKSIQTRTLYVSLSEFRDFSLKQYTVSSPSQMVLGRGNFRRSLYLSTAPENVRAMSSLQIHDECFRSHLIEIRSGEWRENALTVIVIDYHPSHCTDWLFG